MLKMKFLLDENVHHGLLKYLRNLGHDVKLSPKGLRNGRVFDLSVKERRILISRDSDFVDLQFESSSNYGVIFLRIAPRDLEAQKSGISNLLSNFPRHEEFRGKRIRLISSEDFEIL